MNHRNIVSARGLAGGCPVLDGTHLSCADVTMALESMGLDAFLGHYDAISSSDLRESLSYCSERRCIQGVHSYCHGCALRTDEPGGAAVWLLSAKLLRKLNET